MNDTRQGLDFSTWEGTIQLKKKMPLRKQLQNMKSSFSSSFTQHGNSHFEKLHLLRLSSAAATRT